LGLNAFVASPWLLAGAVAIWTLVEIASAPLNSSIVADLAPAALRGRYQGLFSFAWSVAGAFGPLAGAAVLARSATFLWLSCAAVGLLLVAAYATLARHLDSLTKLAPTP
jgi:MFS family permease